MKPTRRDFIKFVVAGAVTSGCPFNLELLAQSAEKRAIVDERRAHHLPSGSRPDCLRLASRLCRS